MPGISLSVTLCLIPLKQGLFLNQKFILVRLDGQWIPRIVLKVVTKCRGTHVLPLTWVLGIWTQVPRASGLTHWAIIPALQSQSQNFMDNPLFPQYHKLLCLFSTNLPAFQKAYLEACCFNTFSHQSVLWPKRYSIYINKVTKVMHNMQIRFREPIDGQQDGSSGKGTYIQDW